VCGSPARPATTAGLALSHLAARVDHTTGSDPIAIAAADLDGDKKPDLAVVNLGSTRQRAAQ
jgi:hypothetical protein